MSVILDLNKTPSIASVDGPVLANSNAETSILPADGVATIPGGALGVGTLIELLLTGRFSNKAAGPGNITFRAKLGAALIWSSGALPLPAVIHTDVVWRLSVILSCRKNGPLAEMFGTGLLWVPLTSDTFHVPAAAPVNSAPFDSTIDRDLDVTAQWSVADVGNTLRVHQFMVRP